MKINEIAELTKSEIIHEPEGYEREIKFAGASDLMSDVLAYLSEMPPHEEKDMMLVTGLVSLQSIRTAALTDMSLIIFTRGKRINEKVIEAAKNAGMAILSTNLTTYSTCGLLYSAEIKGLDKE